MDAIERSALLGNVEEKMQIRDFESIYEILEGISGIDLLEEPQLAFYLALARSHTGRETAALNLIRSLLATLRRVTTSRLLLRSLNLEGALLMESGDLVGASERFDEVLSFAYDIQDVRFVAAASMNLSTLAAMRHQWDRAILDLTRSIAVSSNAGMLHQVGGCHHNLGMVFRETNQFGKSVSHFERALKLLEAWGTPEERVATEYEWAFAIARMGQLQYGLHRAVRALECTRRLENLRLEGEARRIVGTILVYNGETKEARLQLEKARLMAKDLRLPMLTAEILEVLALLAGREGKGSEAEEMRGEAVRLYASVGIPHGKIDIWFPDEASWLPVRAS